MNVSSEVKENADFLLTANHLKAWEQANGPLPDRCVILVNFGWARKFGDRKSYYNGLSKPYRYDIHHNIIHYLYIDCSFVGKPPFFNLMLKAYTYIIQNTIAKRN